MNETKTIYLITGGRDFIGGARAKQFLLNHIDTGSVVIHGAADGADTFANEIAKTIPGCIVIPIPAWWSEYKMAAGPIRNQLMLDLAKLLQSGMDGVNIRLLAFPGGSGTNDMVKRCDRAGIFTVRFLNRADGEPSLSDFNEEAI